MPPPKRGTIQAKRKSVTPEALKRKRLEGQDVSNSRAFMRLNVSTSRVLSGYDDIEDWDDEEIRRGRRRDKSGRFRGADPKVVPKAITDELTRRLLSQAEELMRDNLAAAVQVLIEIVSDEHGQFEAKDRLTATKMIMDRVMGKEPMRLELSQEKPWQVALRGGIVSTDTEDEEDDDDADA